jgi:hypothetical protein
MMCVEITWVSQCRGGLAPAVSLRSGEWSGSQCLGLSPGAVSGDVGIPGVSGGDDGVQLPQDRCGDFGLRM